ncbi:MAG: hypothetical protein Q7S38_00860 [bacterium]|nr:hypothetical protein [bacterium]
MAKLIRRRRKKPLFRYLVFFCVVSGALFLLIFLGYTFLSSLFSKSSFVSPVPIIVSKINFVQNPNQEQFERILKEHNVSFSSIAVASDSSYIVRLQGGEEVIFSPKKNIEAQVASLQLIQKRLTIEGKSFIKLDLRFTNPIIVFK